MLTLTIRPHPAPRSICLRANSAISKAGARVLTTKNGVEAVRRDGLWTVCPQLVQLIRQVSLNRRKQSRGYDSVHYRNALYSEVAPLFSFGGVTDGSKTHRS